MNLITGFSISLVRKCSELCKLSYKKLNAFKNYNVIAYSEDNSRYHPNWYLVEDSNKDYFLTIRGSASADDWATDFEFDEITRVFSGQSINFHSGFYKAASNVFRKVKPYINKSPKRFYITGHSYGASVSAILCTLAKLDADVSSKVDGAICFAPAPSMSYCPDQAYKYIASIVNDDDIVPTLSIQNGYFLVKPMLKVGTPTVLAVASIIRGATDLFKQISLTQYGKDFYSNLGQSVDKIAEKVIQFHETPKNFKVRYVSGTTYHLKNGKKTLNECIVSQSTIFNSVSITLTSIVRHDMSGYDSKLDKLNY